MNKTLNKTLRLRMIALIITLVTNLLLLTTPALAMTDMQGNKSHIDSLTGQGKWTVFKVWASDCHACQKTIHYLSEFKAAYPAADIYGISIDGQEGKAKAGHFISRFNVKFPNLLSDAVEMDDYLYGKAGETLMGTPTLIVYNPQGRLLAVQPGAVSAKDLISFIKREEQQNTKDQKSNN